MKQLALSLLLLAPLWAKSLPYQQAGLTPAQAAAHLLSRFSYGACPGQVQRVSQGLDLWWDQQLQANGPDSLCRQQLQAFPALAMSSETIRQTYLAGPQLRKMAQQAGLKEDRREVARYVRQQGLQTERDLGRQLLGQKLVRCLSSEQQLQEVMTEFWFNHFNVSRTSNPARIHILSYERDVIRPLALENFPTLLRATAQHPAMLWYLNNAQSFAPQGKRGGRGGLNENYARELLELHTLGVEGGYTQRDVTEVARILTGWTSPRGAAGQRLLERGQPGPHGFVFVPFLHDPAAKKVLGHDFPAGQGQAEGERLLDLLAHHPRTAQRIALKLATRFVSDQPDPALVQQLAQVYLATQGDIRAMLRALVESPAFWSAQSLRAKVKTPSEYTLSALRALGGELQGESELPQWLEKMGQTLYGCVPPTGYPDRSEHWITSGTMVARLNFAQALVSHKIRGCRVTLPSGSLEQVAGQLLPGRPLEPALGPVRQTLKGQSFQQLRQSERIVGVLISSPEFQRR